MSAYEEIIAALKFYCGFEEMEESDAMNSINEIIGQDHDPVATIAAALDDYRSVGGEKTNV